MCKTAVFYFFSHFFLLFLAHRAAKKLALIIFDSVNSVSLIRKYLGVITNARHDSQNAPVGDCVNKERQFLDIPILIGGNSLPLTVCMAVESTE